MDRCVSQNQETGNAGKLLLETQCYGCHDATSNENERLAPPMVAIKARYLKNLSSKKDFEDAIWAFVEKPTVEKAKIKRALDRFGLIPYQPFKEKEIRLISYYMFKFQIEAPAWFKRNWQRSHGEKKDIQQSNKMRTSSFQDKDRIEKGLVIAKRY